MTVILLVLTVGLVSGALAALVLRRWPGVDPASAGVGAHAVRNEIERHPRSTSLLSRRTDPAAATGLLLTVLLGIAAVGVIATGALLVMVHTGSGFARWDQSAGEWGARHATSVSTTFLRDVSILGGTMFTIVAAVVVGVVQTVRTRRPAVVAFLTTVLIGVTIVLNVTKLVVDRARPDIRRLTGFSGSSFPSGHAGTAAACFAALALVIGLGCSPRTKAVLSGAAVGIAAAVASSRVLLGVHWLTDVMAGLAVGWAWFAFCSIAFGGRMLRFGAPIEAAERVLPADDDDPAIAQAGTARP